MTIALPPSGCPYSSSLCGGADTELCPSDPLHISRMLYSHATCISSANMPALRSVVANGGAPSTPTGGAHQPLDTSMGTNNFGLSPSRHSHPESSPVLHSIESRRYLEISTNTLRASSCPDYPVHP
uniref:Uncharacterized protein n=1 Tax=Arundo donax TaxID=35708 RepID=A0A0A9CNN0_ARUDO